MPDLLLELYSEEIPAGMQPRAEVDLRRLVTEGLVASGLTYAHAGAFSTPRRLTLHVEGLSPHSPARREERRGPRADAPEKAIAGFLRSTGLTRDTLVERADKKGTFLYATIETPGRAASDIVAELLPGVIRGFPWPKSMRWGTGALRWVRPLHSILCVLSDVAGTQLVAFEVDGIVAGDVTRGHPFHAPQPFSVTGFEDYRTKLRRARVMLSAQERADHIWIEAHNRAFAQGLEVVEDRALLADIAGLTEWPVVLTGPIGAEFQSLPPEVLQTSMKTHQKFLSLRNPGTGRIEGFVAVADRETADDGATILAGNRRVLAARLADARFFWEADLRAVGEAGLEGMAARLAAVTFHSRLGTQSDRIGRIAALAREVAPMVGAKPDLAAEAARVAKADLASAMVAEFPELQGVMGQYYAQAAGHDDGVPEACAAHYRPMGPADAVPTAPVSVAVALADKIDMLTGFWAIGEKPTGSKDPFALRRAALGAIRIVLENGLRLRLCDLFATANGAADAGDLLSFLHDRLKVHLREEGLRHDIIDAALSAPGADDLWLLVHRARALAAFLATEDGDNLLQGFRRAHNLLKQAEAADGVAYSFGPDPKLARDATETALFDALDAAEPAIETALQAEDFAAAMTALAGLRGPVDAFFEAVKINDDNPVIRRNRLNLLHRLCALALQTADLTRIEGG
ncbi:MAG TPA: glycine--tRNA ligase subunit beta [Rhodobacteraceae bacterium]|jgi:glycyl-tRNA synthetase beta chain|nr:glycine--tRNA ligase subunit beta [Paracoccaceae bacterium]HBG99305.1 glycine--tRNA ligase subunit beta [Paracoccaceae bacterium]